MAPHLANIHIPLLRTSESDSDVLGDWDLNDVGRTFSAKLPGFRPTSSKHLLPPQAQPPPVVLAPANHQATAFLTTLRSNLQLSATGSSSSLPPSAISTPTASAFFRGPPLAASTSSPLSSNTLASAVPVTMATAQPEEESIPELTYQVAPADSEERVEALKLVADSVAQQRQVASKAIIFHPFVLATAIVLVGIVSRYVEIPTLVTTATGMIMAGLVMVRWYTSEYIRSAEKIGFKWLEDYGRQSSPNGNGNGNGGNTREPVVLVAKWGDEVIGALIMRVFKRQRMGYVRAWTVKLKFRNKGIGRGLLEEAAKIVWGKGGRGMVFEEDHANAKRFLPEYLNGPFERNEVKARNALAEVVAETRKERSSR